MKVFRHRRSPQAPNFLRFTYFFTIFSYLKKFSAETSRATSNDGRAPKRREARGNFPPISSFLMGLV